MQNQSTDKLQVEEKKRKTKFSDSITTNSQLLKEFEDSFKERTPTKFIRGGFIGADEHNIDQRLAYEKGQLYDMNNVPINQNIQNFFNTKFSNVPIYPNNLSPSFQNISPVQINQNYQNIDNQNLDKKSDDKKNLKGTSLIREIISDNENTFNSINIKDSDKNSNLYLCNLSPFITEDILTREFGSFGKIESIKIIPPKAENIKHFIAFINFSNSISAENALLAKQNKIILGQPVKIKYGKKLTPQPSIVKPINTEQNSVKPLIPQIQAQYINNVPLISQPTVELSGGNYPTVAQNIVNIAPTPNINQNFVHNNPYQIQYTQSNLPFQQFPPVNPYNQFYSYPQNQNFPNYSMFSLPYIYVKFPETTELKNRIDKVSELVYKEGYLTEQNLLINEKDNPDYRFMILQGTDENNFYRWRVFSLFQGDSLNDWRKEPFQMFIGGPIWVPPVEVIEIDKKDLPNNQQISVPENNIENQKENKDEFLLESENSSDFEDEEDKEIASKYNQIGKIPLTSKKREIFKEILKYLTINRLQMKIALTFCYENIKNAEEIIQIIFQYIKESKNFNNKLLYLYLISDLFYNSKNKNIFNSHCFKNEIEANLPDIFEDLNYLYQSFEGRINAESLKDQISNLIKIWRGWQIIEDDFCHGLEYTLLKKKKKSENESLKSVHSIKNELEIYEDELLEIVSENPEDIKSLARSKGISVKGELRDIISKLVSLKEQILINEYQIKEKKENEKNIANKYKEKIFEMDLTIENLKMVFDSMQKSYKKIKENELDGLIVDVIEYKYMHFEDIDDEIEMIHYNNSRKNLQEKIESYKEEQNKCPGITNLKNEIYNVDDDIDGEPI